MTDLLARAQRAARSAGELLLARPDDLAVSSKTSATDAVTAMDRASEELLADLLLADGPDDSILGEEGGQRIGSSPVRWVLDPLDGTVNYLYGIPEWAVSVAAEISGVVTVGVVICPALDVQWWAVAGGGAWRQRGSGPAQQVMVGSEQRLGHALMGTGFGYTAQRRRWQAALLANVLPHIRDIRRAGAAAVDLCRVADGTLDGYFERGLQPWDHAAGGLIAAEAGAVVTGWPGEAAGESMTIATNSALAPALLQALTNARNEVAVAGIADR